MDGDNRAPHAPSTREAPSARALTPAGALLLTRSRTVLDAAWLPAVIAAVEREMALDGGHDHGHLWRVLANAEHIRRREDEAGRLPDGASAEAIVAAALLHDLVNLPKNHPERSQASSLSADRAVAVLRGTDFPASALQQVAEAIRCHSFSSGLEARSPEARIVADADRLESIGAFAIARTFYVNGLMSGQLVDFADPFARGERRLDDRRFAVDHFYAKLLRLRDRLYTPAARALADQRHAFMEEFLTQLGREMPDEVLG